jgi:hAT family C-terminal dimerisation region
VIPILAQVKGINEELRGALVTIRRSKVLRQSYRAEALRCGYASKEPTHQDSPTRWNSTHQMCSDALEKREALDQTMMLHEDELGRGSLSNTEWSKIGTVVNFLRLPRQVMESLAADKKSSLDLVQISVANLIRHCETNTVQLQVIDASLSSDVMKSKLQMYEKKLVQLPAIVAGYLNPQVKKPTDPTKLRELKTTIRTILNKRYSDKLLPIVPSGAGSSAGASEQSNQMDLCATFFSGSGDSAPAEGDDDDSSGVCDEVERYLAMGIVVSHVFIDVVQYWIGRKEQLPGHYHMAMDFLGTPATSTPSERVNSTAGREFTTARQSLSTDIFIKTMCLRSWMKAGVIKVPVDRQKALMSLTRLPAAAAAATIDDVVSTIEVDQEEWVEEVLDDSALDMLNNQFDHLTAEEPEA